ncbi:MAG: argininosuccinate synthase [Candidatus Altiarchaeales archaeon IMC4]|nr:MAG: argininosuccinate synthase [Candidatus Altiarchaeales archaeon IMC4]
MKIVLAYSGGLDTSVAIKWLKEKYNSEVVTLTLEVGQGEKDLKAIEEKAKKIGAVKTYSIDAREEFVEDYVFPAIKANALYEGKYPVSTAIARPLIAKWMVAIAEKEGADAVAHGSTGKGNDQVRFDVSVMALNPLLKIVAPMREWKLTRDDSIEYAKKHGIPVPATKKSPYSTDENLWGRSCEAGILENPMNEPKEEAYGWTTAPEAAPDKAQYVTIDFEKGVPVKLDGKKMGGVELITRLNKIGGTHGIGRIDMIEDRLVGIKSREVYECPAADILLTAHKELERLVLTREENLFKEMIDAKWAQMAYFGLWYEPLKKDLDAFIEKTQEVVTGTVKIKLYKGKAAVAGRSSPKSLYDEGLATYNKSDKFDHRQAEGFIKIWGLPSMIAGKRK